LSEPTAKEERRKSEPTDMQENACYYQISTNRIEYMAKKCSFNRKNGDGAGNKP
jgi:hypothetical protein